MVRVDKGEKETLVSYTAYFSGSAHQPEERKGQAPSRQQKIKRVFLYPLKSPYQVVFSLIQ